MATASVVVLTRSGPKADYVDLPPEAALAVRLLGDGGRFFHLTHRDDGKVCVTLVKGLSTRLMMETGSDPAGVIAILLRRLAEEENGIQTY